MRETTSESQMTLMSLSGLPFLKFRAICQVCNLPATAKWRCYLADLWVPRPSALIQNMLNDLLVVLSILRWASPVLSSLALGDLYGTTGLPGILLSQVYVDAG